MRAEGDDEDENKSKRLKGSFPPTKQQMSTSRSQTITATEICATIEITPPSSLPKEPTPGRHIMPPDANDAIRLKKLTKIIKPLFPVQTCIAHRRSYPSNTHNMKNNGF
jgi:hypothetical protein